MWQMSTQITTLMQRTAAAEAQAKEAETQAGAAEARAVGAEATAIEALALLMPSHGTT